MTSRELLRVVKEAAESKKARGIVEVDLRKRSDMADFFVICEGDTDRQTRAIADAIRDATTSAGQKPFTVSGERDGAWILMDYIEVIVHVFLPGERSFYDLETLWRTAPMIELSQARTPAPRRPPAPRAPAMRKSATRTVRTPKPAAPKTAARKPRPAPGSSRPEA